MFDIIRGRSQSVITKLIFGLIILAFIFLGVGNFAGSSSTVVAEVNGDSISAQDFWNVYSREFDNQRSANPQFGNDKNQVNQLRVEVLAQMIQERLKLQEAERLGLFVTPHELLTVISSMGLFQDEKGRFDVNRYQEMLKTIKQTPAQFEAGYKRSLLQEKLTSIVTASIGVTDEEAKNYFNFSLEQRTAEYVLFAKTDYLAKAVVTDEEIATYYAEHKESFLEPARMNISYVLVTPQAMATNFTITPEEAKAHYEANTEAYTVPESFRVRHIFLRGPGEGATEAQATELNKRAQDIMATLQEELRKGTPFADLATKYSDDTASAQEGGDMGWLSKGDIPLPEFEEAALALKPGEVSAPLKTSFGMHLIKLEEKKPVGVRPFAEVKDQIKTKLAQEKALADEERVRKLAAEELGKGTPLAEIAAALHLKVESSGLVDKNTIPQLLNMTPDAMKTVENIPLGETAPAPIEMKDGVVLLSVQEATTERIPPQEDVRERIVALLKDIAATRLAEDAAKNALAEFTGTDVPKAFVGKTKISEPFSRLMPVLGPLGSAPALVERLNSNAPGTWLSQTYEVPQGTVIARVHAIIPADPKEWDAQSAMVKQSLLRGKQQDALTAFMQNLVSKASITENMELLFKL